MIDGFHSGFWGAYGNSWISTPTLDEWACESILLDRYYTNSLELAEIYHDFWSGDLLNRLKEEGYRTILATDDMELAETIADGLFDVVHFFDEQDSFFGPTQEEQTSHVDQELGLVQPAETIDQTRFFRFLTELHELATQSAGPYFLWGHWGGLRKVWDSPSQIRAEYVEEGDPPPFPGLTPPLWDLRGEKQEILFDPDDLQSVVETYSAEITVLDTLLAGLHESLQSGELGEHTLFLLGATRGFPLGEHRLVGIPSDRSLLWAENVHLPFLIRFPDLQDRMTRTSILMQPGHISAILAQWCEGVKMAKPFFDDETSPEHLFISGEPGERAIVTRDWFFKKADQTVELYVKPDDRWEVNEVADRCSETVDELINKVDRLINKTVDP